MSHSPKQFKLNQGIDAYNPEVVAAELTMFYLNNVEPRLGRLMSTRGYGSFQAFASLGITDAFVGFAFYQLSNRRFVNLYAFSKSNVYWFNFQTNAFETTPVYTGFPSTDDPYVFIPWYDALYVTKLGGAYVKLERATYSVIAGGLQARYGIVNNSHAYLGGVSDGVSLELARIRWSDLDDPESFTLDASASEADFFDLEPDSREITGMTMQRSNSLVYAQNTIWVGSYVGFPGGFRHDPLFPGIGNIFHDAVVHAKDLDYFIGPDNIYAVNGFQLVPIGDKIYERFIADVSLTPATLSSANTISVKGFLDTRKNQVFWVYPSAVNNPGGLWSIVYNYKEDKWSERDAQKLTSWFDAPRVAMRGYDSIDAISTVIDDDSDIIDDPAAGYVRIVPQLAGTNFTLVGTLIPTIGKADDSYVKLINTAMDQKMETTDFFWEEIGKVKEVTKVILEYTGAGTPNLNIYIGTRHNQFESITWSNAVAVDTTTAGVMTFFVKAEAVGRYLRFRFTWGNTAVSYITDLRLISFVKVENQENGEEK